MNNLCKTFIIIIFLLITNQNLSANNKAPIVLVHGFLGWGKDEIGDINYWGGTNDIEAYLQSKGYKVFSVSVGPISSNYDCAVETFFQIKGGQLDYGEKHSEKYGLVQRPKGKVYKGFFPEWDSHNPVHLVGYSFGGQTIRMLQHLLETKTDFENEIPNLLLDSNLNNWVKSITTMSTPLNGATIADITSKLLPFSDNIMPIINVFSTGYYDLDLYQWGLNKKEAESLFGYINRLIQNKAWNTKNSIAYDATLAGAKNINNMISINPNTYYFSYSTSCSKKDPSTGYHIPKESLSLANYPLCYLMGRINIKSDENLRTDSTWFENDGTVNTISMVRPFTGDNGPEPMKKIEKGEKPEPGVWNFMGEYNLDHKNFIGFFIDGKEMIDDMMTRFENHAALLYSLP